VLQNICAAIIAINGMRLAIGLGSLAMEVGFGARLLMFHEDWLRVPMMLVATIGSLVPLGIVLNVRHLRSKPASKWRQIPVGKRQARAEWVQIAIAAATLSLIALEEWLHLIYEHSL
jgi:hypothetical protein